MTTPTTDRIGGLTRTRKSAPAGATTRIQFDSTTGNPATVFVRNNATTVAITVDATPDDAGTVSPLVCPLGIGSAGSIPAGATASTVLPSALRAILITVPTEADAAADVVVLE